MRELVQLAGSEGAWPSRSSFPDTSTLRLYPTATIRLARRSRGIHLHRRARVLLRPSAGFYAQSGHSRLPEHHRHRQLPVQHSSVRHREGDELKRPELDRR